MANSVYVVQGYDASVYVERGHLVIRDGFPGEGKSREIRFPRGRCEIHRILFRAPGGSISLSALDWCARMGVALSFVASDSSLLNCMIPDAPHDGPIKRAQAVSAVTYDALRLARYLLTKKMDSQIVTIDRDFPRLGIGNLSARSTATAQVQACKASLMETQTLVEFLALEGRAAQVYWDLLVETALPWKEWALKRIPAHWAAVSPRTSGKRDRVRDATDPFNAILNYCYTLLEVETRIACEAMDLILTLGYCMLMIVCESRSSTIYSNRYDVRLMFGCWNC
jgi:CRISPR/Cas system-associated endonuclease Cas1